jgi:hypothetical protein
MWACILNPEFLLFCMFWQILVHFLFRIRHYLWYTLSKYFYHKNELLWLVVWCMAGVFRR